jgi:transporter family-2 protein
MSSVLVIILVGLAGGIAVGLQSPLASMLTQRLGIFEAIFIVHIGGAVFAALPLLFLRGGELGQWRSVPWYALCAGFLGLMTVGAVSYIVPRMGVAAAVITLVAGQLIVGTLLDHFRWLGVAGRSLDAPRLLGLAVVLLGVWLTVK